MNSLYMPSLPSNFCYLPMELLGGIPSLHDSAYMKNIDRVKYLLIHGEDPRKKNDKGQTALHCAAIAGSEEIVKLLTLNNSNVNELDSQGHTPLYNALYTGKSEDIVWFLINNGAYLNPNSKCKRKDSHLHPKRTFSDAVNHFLFCEIQNINKNNEEGLLILQSCVHTRKLKLARLLIIMGAEINSDLGFKLMNEFLDQIVIYPAGPDEEDFDLLGMLVGFSYNVNVINSCVQNMQVSIVFKTLIKFKQFAERFEELHEEDSEQTCHMIIDSLIKEIAKQKVNGHLMSDEYRQAFTPTELELYDKCVKELEEMKNTKFYERFSFADLVLPQFVQKFGFLQNTDFLNAIETYKSLEYQFSEYSGSIDFQLQRLERKHNLVDITVNILQKIMQNKISTDIIVNQIIPHFAIWDMFELIRFYNFDIEIFENLIKYPIST